MKSINKEIIRSKKIFIFDLDGTIINTINLWNKVDYILIRKYYKKRINKNSIELERNLFLKSNNIGNVYLNYCEYLKKRYSIKINTNILYNEREMISKKLLKHAKPIKNVGKVLNKLRNMNYILVLATASSNNEIEIFKKNIYTYKLIDKFDLILTANNVEYNKPNPEIYNKVLKICRESKEKCIIVEDSLIGITAGYLSGIDTIYLENKNSLKDIREIDRMCTFKIYNYNVLLKYINKL